jgi:hypothetical protein
MHTRLASALAVMALAVAATAGLVACDSAESITVENKTSRTVVVYEDGEPTELIRPGATRSFETLQFRGTLTYQVRYFCAEDACDQSVLAERTFTWDDMQDFNGVTITVEPSALGDR